MDNQIESLTLTKQSGSHSIHSPEQKKTLIREWLARFAINAGQALTGESLGVYQSLWEEGFSDLDYEVLEAAFRKAIKIVKFWPVKIADIRESVDKAKQNADEVNASAAWDHLLKYCNRWIDRDMPGGKFRGAPELPHRITVAARTAGGFFYIAECSTDDLIWARKRFIESYLAINQLEEDQFLLADGEIKEAMQMLGEMKQLPSVDLELSAQHLQSQKVYLLNKGK